MPPAPSAIVLYHFLHPDDVVSAQIWTTLATHLHSSGWQINAAPSNRSCHGSNSYPLTETHEGVTFHRIWHPDFRQGSPTGRLLNSAWMLAAWSWLAATQKPDVVLIGTDPILSVLTAPLWRLLSPKTRIAHWCFDLYPEAAVADGLLKPNGPLVCLLSRLARRAYRSCDLIVDIGPCMRERLNTYHHPAQTATLTPWALEESKKEESKESPHPRSSAFISGHNSERHALFGAAKLGLLYSGSFGRAHIFEPFLVLARAARHLEMELTFSVRGNREPALRAAIQPDDHNISIVDFATPDRLEARLAAADIHLVSLHEDWTGTVVPSKFFGALAVGRPVLFAGSPNSTIAQYICQFKVGWVLDPDNPAAILPDLEALTADPSHQKALNEHCAQIYKENFSQAKMCAAWAQLLQELISRPRPPQHPR